MQLCLGCQKDSQIYSQVQTRYQEGLSLGYEWFAINKHLTEKLAPTSVPISYKVKAIGYKFWQRTLDLFATSFSPGLLIEVVFFSYHCSWYCKPKLNPTERINFERTCGVTSSCRKRRKNWSKKYVYTSSNYVNITCKENIKLDLPWALAEPGKDKKAFRKNAKTSMKTTPVQSSWYGIKLPINAKKRAFDCLKKLCHEDFADFWY